MNTCSQTMQWVEDTYVLEMIVDKFGSSDSPEVHANAAEILFTVARYAPPFIGLYNLIQLHWKTLIFSEQQLDDLAAEIFNQIMRRRGSKQRWERSDIKTSKERNLLSLDPFGRWSRVPSEARENIQLVPQLLTNKTLIFSEQQLDDLAAEIFNQIMRRRGSKQRWERSDIKTSKERNLLSLDPFGRWSRVPSEARENIQLVPELLTNKSKNSQLLDHLLNECNIIGSIREADKDPILTATDSDKENSEWVDWQIDVLSKRNTLENFYSWACRGPTSLRDRNRDSDDDDYHDRDYDVAALANNLSQAFRYGIYNNDDMDLLLVINDVWYFGFQ
ncbi:hypothetical protein Bca101_068298 [Brassica carinata]